MKTRQSTGYYQQVCLILLLCFVSSFVNSGSVLALSGNLINQCSDCHGTAYNPLDLAKFPGPADIRPVDATYRDITSGGIVGNHRTHITAVTTVSKSCEPCHGAPAPSSMSHRDGQISINTNIHNSRVAGVYKKAGIPKTFFNQTSVPILGVCSNVNCHFENDTPVWGAASFASQKTASNSDPNNTCIKCHTSTPATLLTGKHNQHISKYGNDFTSCAKCHPDNFVKTGVAAFAHATSNTNSIKISFAAAPNNGTGTVSSLRTASSYLPSAATASSATCSTLYCHKGASVTPAWNGAATTCSSCHDASNTGLSTRHAQHYNSAAVPTVLAGGVNAHTTSAYVYACLNCHPTTQHVTGAADSGAPVLQDATVVGGTKITTHTQGGTSATDTKLYNYTVNATCTSVCHTRTGVITDTPVVTANWSGAATGGCAVCHRASGDNYSVMTTDANRLSSVHAQHMSTDRYGANTANFTCEACHTTTAASNTTLQATVQARTQHPDTVKNVAFGTFAGGTWSGTQCSNTYCHSGGTAAAGAHSAISWSGTLNTECSSCHGGNSAAASKITSMLHAQHLYSTARVGRNFVCGDCHSATVSIANDRSVTNYTVHVNKSVNINFSTSRGLNRDSDNPTYNGGSANVGTGYAKSPGTAGYTCNNLYCHSSGNLGTSGNIVNAGGVKFKSVAWNGTALGCAGCHGDGATKSYPVYVSLPAQAGYSSSNSHVKHVESSGLGCDYCHYNTVNQTSVSPTQVRLNNFSGHLNRVANVRFKLNGGLTGTYTPGNLGATTKTCSSTYCHGTGPSVAWGGTAACSSCHAVTNQGGHAIHAATFTARFNVMSGNVSSGTTARFGCAACHNPNLAQHAKGEASAGVRAADVFYLYTSTGKGSLATYANGIAGGTDGSLKWTAATAAVCNNTYCHSNGQSGGSFVAGTATPSWATTTLSNGTQPACTGCHGNASSAAGVLSAKHANHLNTTVNVSLVNALGCVDCHAKTVTNSTTISNKLKHVNKFVEYSGAKAYRSTYSGGNCTTYCHTNGNPGASGDQKTVSWTAGANITDCKGCHGSQTTGVNGFFISQFGEPNYNNFSSPARDSFNAHNNKHVKAITDCYTCHNTTVQASGALAAGAVHMDKTRTVSFNTALAGASASYNSLTQRCSNVTCHSGTQVRWGQTLNCSSCHPLASLSGAHARHSGYYIANRTISVYSNLTANKSAGADTGGAGGAQSAPYGFGCSVCHPLNNTNHGNGTVQILLTEAGSGTIKTKTTAGTYTGTPGTGSVRCQNVYCHSNGKTTLTFGNTSTWRYAYKPTDRCSMCHGNAPTGTAHDSHVVSLHNDDIYSGGIGKLATSGAVGVNAGHGDSGQATTISCYLCHNGTTTVTRNKYSTSCSSVSCHGNATGLNADATGAIYITSLGKHVNGAVDVQFAAIQVKTKAQVRPAAYADYTSAGGYWTRTTYKAGAASTDTSKLPLNSTTMYSAGTCSNIACHNGKSVNWTTDTGKGADCVICHSKLGAW